MLVNPKHQNTQVVSLCCQEKDLLMTPGYPLQIHVLNTISGRMLVTLILSLCLNITAITTPKLGTENKWAELYYPTPKHVSVNEQGRFLPPWSGTRDWIFVPPTYLKYFYECCYLCAGLFLGQQSNRTECRQIVLFTNNNQIWRTAQR